MEINITCSDYEKRLKLQEIVNSIKNHEQNIGLSDSQLFIDYPIFQDYESVITFPTICIVSRTKGIILLFLNEQERGTDIEIILKKADQTLNQIFALLIKSSKLRFSRQSLKVPINSFVVSDYIKKIGITSYAEEFGVILTNSSGDLISKINEISPQKINDDVFDEMYSIIEGIKSIQKQKTRKIPDGYDNSKGALLEKLSDQISRFDKNQRIAALCCIDGPQRIRGLAGSGKTIILAIKTAVFHLRYPEKKILYTFWTKSLYDQVKLLISKFYRLYSSSDPNWDMVNIKHAWGGINLAGVYYDTCLSNGVSPLTFRDAQKRYVGKGKEFEFICEQLLEATKGNLKKEYDLILIDEGQDFSAPFYWLCRKLVKNDSLVWAYDELQNVLNVEMQNSIDLFKNKYGDEGIDLMALSNEFYKNDLVLDVCYRNPLEVLMIAHGLGFGIYNATILQMLENAEHWSDLGYKIISGDCQKDKDVIIERPKKNSPSLMSLSQAESQLIVVKIFDSFSEEIKYVVDEVQKNIKNDYLLPEDIMIICLDDRNSKNYFNRIEKELSECGIQVNNITNSFTGDHFFIKGALTLTTVYRAKGNESGMVYIVGTDAYNLFSRADINIRNKLFTAITRTKAWVRITGLQEMDWISKEIDTIMSNIPNFKFKYPDLAQIKILRRELTADAEENNKKLKLMMEQIASMSMSQEEIINYLVKNANFGKK